MFPAITLLLQVGDKTASMKNGNTFNTMIAISNITSNGCFVVVCVIIMLDGWRDYRGCTHASDDAFLLGRYRT